MIEGKSTGDVRVEDRSKGAIVSRRQRGTQRFAVAGFLPNPFENQYVASPPCRCQDYTRDSRQGQCRIDRTHHPEQDDDVHHQRESATKPAKR